MRLDLSLQKFGPRFNSAHSLSFPDGLRCHEWELDKWIDGGLESDPSQMSLSLGMPTDRMVCLLSVYGNILT